jgi:hypothetical protein
MPKRFQFPTKKMARSEQLGLNRFFKHLKEKGDGPESETARTIKMRLDDNVLIIESTEDSVFSRTIREGLKPDAREMSLDEVMEGLKVKLEGESDESKESSPVPSPYAGVRVADSPAREDK